MDYVYGDVVVCGLCVCYFFIVLVVRVVFEIFGLVIGIS